jgi:isopentenyldiphosphate isomerase
MEKPRIIIVDATDTPIGLKKRGEVDDVKDIYRCTGVWITNSEGQVLIAKRKLTKDKDPGKWGPAVSGTVEEGETYESNALKETEEEIGLTGVSLDLGPKKYIEHPRKYFAQWFFCKVDKPIGDFVIQKDEVDQVAWIGKNQLVQEIKKSPEKYTPSFSAMIDILINKNL